MVWVLSLCPLRGEGKIRPATQLPRWIVHSNGVHMLLVCDHALVQGKQTITRVQIWAVHTDTVIHEWARCTSHLRRKLGRRLDDLGGVCIAMGYKCCWHANRHSCNTNRRSLMCRYRQCTQTRSCTSGRGARRTDNKSSPPRMCTYTQTKHLMAVIERL